MRVVWREFVPCLLAIVLCAVVSACTGPRAATESRTGDGDPFRRVELGMRPADVRSAIGPPLRTIRADGALVWMVYGTSAERVRIHFDDNVVAAVPRRDRTRSRGRRTE